MAILAFLTIQKAAYTLLLNLKPNSLLFKNKKRSSVPYAVPPVK